MYIDDQLFGMSSYRKYFFRMKKYKFGAFQRRIGRHRVTPGYDFRRLYIYIALSGDQDKFLPRHTTYNDFL